jgi:hypothetical protein
MSDFKKGADPDLEELNFLKAFAVNNVVSNLSLEEEERAANALLRAAYAKSKKFQEDHNYALPDHLEQFRRGYEKADHKAKGRIPMVSTLSPRTRRELSLLPPPNAFEEKKIDRLLDLSKKTDKSSLYGQLAQQPPVGDEPRFSAIVNSHMVLIPHNAVKDVGKASTHYFETMEHAKQRKQEQDAKLARLFDKYKDAASDEPTKGRSKTPSGQSRGNAAPRSPSRGKRVLPKLALCLLPTAATENTERSSAGGPTDVAQAADASVASQPTSSAKKANSTKASGGFSLSRSLTSLTAAPARAALTNNAAAVLARPSSMEGKIGSPKKPAAAVMTSVEVTVSGAHETEAETLVAENTPLLYSLFKSNPVFADRGLRYSQSAMEQIINERYQHESDRLARITAKLQQKSEQEYLNLFSVKVLDEIGLDLNKEYNKIRNYTIYLMQLSYHFYIQRMRAGFVHFHAQYAKIREARLKHARKVIFRSVQMGIYILTQNEKRRRRVEQDRAEELRRLAADAEFRRKCLIVYRSLFYHKQMKILRRRVRQRRMATRIQRRLRGVIGRRIAREWRALKALLSRSALVIQCAYRQRLAWRKVRDHCLLCAVHVL